MLCYNKNIIILQGGTKVLVGPVVYFNHDRSIVCCYCVRCSRSWWVPWGKNGILRV